MGQVRPQAEKKHSEELLLTVRLKLLSKHALNQLHDVFAFRNSEECPVVIKEVLEDKESCRNKLNLCSTPRGEEGINVLFYDTSDVNSPEHFQQGIGNKKSMTKLARI